MTRLCFFCLVIGAALLASPSLAHGQCRPGYVLIGEDEHYWYCAAPASNSDLGEVVENLEKERPEILGEQWRFRKAVIDAAGSLAREGTKYQFGGKLRITSEGRVVHICVAKECRNDPEVGVDCSGLIEHATRYSACFVDGFYRAASRSLEGLENDAAGQAKYFKRHGAFLGPSASPTPGDSIFFENTARKRKGITHVAIFLGTTRDGRTVILHASSAANPPRVLFTTMSSELAQKIVGYGDISQLYMKVK